MKSLPLSRLAEADLAEISEYVGARSPKAAARLLRQILALCHRICDNPLSYSACERVRPGLRRGLLRPYLVFFTVDQDGVRIERIVHGARDLSALF